MRKRQGLAEKAKTKRARRARKEKMFWEDSLGKLLFRLIQKNLGQVKIKTFFKDCKKSFSVLEKKVSKVPFKKGGKQRKKRKEVPRNGCRLSTNKIPLQILSNRGEMRLANQEMLGCEESVSGNVSFKESGQKEV